MTLYKYRLFLTMYTRFKVVKVSLGLEWTISTRLRVGRYKWY